MLRSRITAVLPLLVTTLKGETAALPCAQELGEGVKACCNVQLDPAKQQQNNHDDE
jgi:hypothetical protein